MKPSFQFAAEVLRWIDGDSVVLRLDLGFSISVTESCRLLGIDTSETRGRDKELKWLGNWPSSTLMTFAQWGQMLLCARTRQNEESLGACYARYFKAKALSA